MSADGFPRGARLLDKRGFDLAFNGSRRHADWFVAHVAPTPEAAGARLGLAIAKRVARDAIDRNRLKRLVREHFRKRRATLPAVAIAITAKAGAAAQTRSALNADLDKLFSRIVIARTAR